jgi:phosphatidylserine decarboxylase
MENQPFLAREGWPFIAASFLLAVGVSFASLLASLPFWLVWVFCLQFFRDPQRTITQGTNLVLAPADGRVIVVGVAQDPYLNRESLKISVFMNVFNVHSNRSPLAGKVMKRWYFPGKFVNAALDKASEANERCALWLETPDGRAITCVQIAGLIARRILCYAQENQDLAPGERYGFIRFGSRVDVYLPVGAQPQVVLGDRVTAGVSVLAKLADEGAPVHV